MLGLCPQGIIILDYCEKGLGQFVLHTLGDLLLHLGNALPQELQLNASANIAEGPDYMYQRGVYMETSNWPMLVCGGEENFKLVDYSCNYTAIENTVTISSYLPLLIINS